MMRPLLWCTSWKTVSNNAATGVAATYMLETPMAIAYIVEWGEPGITESRVVLVITPGSVVDPVPRSAGRHLGHRQPRQVRRDVNGRTRYPIFQIDPAQARIRPGVAEANTCLLYTSDAADEEDSVDLGGRRIIK